MENMALSLYNVFHTSDTCSNLCPDILSAFVSELTYFLHGAESFLRS